MSRTLKPGPSPGERLDIIITQKHLRHHRARLRNGQVGTSVEGGGVPGGQMTGVEVGVLGVGAPQAQHRPQATVGSERPSGVWGLRDPPLLVTSEGLEAPFSCSLETSLLPPLILL